MMCVSSNDILSGLTLHIAGYNLHLFYKQLPIMISHDRSIHANSPTIDGELRLLVVDGPDGGPIARERAVLVRHMAGQG